MDAFRQSSNIYHVRETIDMMLIYIITLFNFAPDGYLVTITYALAHFACSRNSCYDLNRELW